jgi:hypothetical protein
MRTEQERFEALKKICNAHVEEIRKGEDVDCDCEQYVFEAAMQLVHGDDIWKRIEVIRHERDIEKKKRQIAKLQREIGIDDHLDG